MNIVDAAIGMELMVSSNGIGAGKKRAKGKNRTTIALRNCYSTLDDILEIVVRTVAEAGSRRIAVISNIGSRR